MRKNNVQVIKNKLIYEGYQTFRNYDLEIPTLKSDQKKLILHDREVLITLDSVHALLYAPAIDSMIFCEEFRVGVFFNHNEDNPFILQCVAGTIEKNETPQVTAIKEIKEETGLVLNELQLIASVYKCPGIMTEKSYLFYGIVHSVPQSGLFGVDEEEIRTHIVPRNKVYSLMDENKINDSATFMMLSWFRINEGNLAP